jgi:hypothetical protein
MFCLSCTSDKIWNIPELILYLVLQQNSDVEIDIVPEAISLSNLGLYDILDSFKFKSVTIRTWNPLEQHPVYNVVIKGINFWPGKTPVVHESPFLNTHAFLCLYHRPTAARLGIAGHLNNTHADSSIIHFSAAVDPDSRIQFELDKLLQWDVESVPAAAKLISQLPILQSSPDKLTKYHGYDYTDPLTNLYQSIFVDVVVESHVAGQTFFPTDKTCRPMILGRPFIIFGSCDYLAYLRQMGFRTFWEYWDEDYDGYDSSTRLRKIYQLLDDIASMTTQQRQQLYQAIKPIIDHNRNLIISKQWNTQIELIDDK